MEAIVDHVLGRFEALEEREVARLAEIVDFIEGDGCHWRRLAGHFGETLAAPCGRCTHCATGRRVSLLPATRADPLPSPRSWPSCAGGTRSSAEPRVMARFLCGLSSPALSRAKLTRHPRFRLPRRGRLSPGARGVEA
jgi:ATP-dependent DNA helicase RecQ